MIKCSRCKVNAAVIFVSKVENGHHADEALCLECARKMNIGPINDLLARSGMSDTDLDSVNQTISSFLESAETSLTELDPEMDADEENGEEKNTVTDTTEKKAERRRYKFLEKYSVNLTKKAAAGKLDPVLGRDREMDRVLQILNRRTKNNPVLIGEPGVGKTAIVEGLALRVVQGRVPRSMTGCQFHVLDMAAMVAGTQFRGQFEARMKGLLDEAAAHENMILVIDELHTIAGSGDTDSGMSAANILKPALVRGEVRVIGTTTLTEYRKHIEKNAALERRFQPVMVQEPGEAETIVMIQGLRAGYENYHHILIPDEVVTKAVEFARRYIHDRYMPDKVIDLLDEAGARANLDNNALVELETLKEELKHVQRQKEHAVLADNMEDYRKAADLKVRECQLKQRIQEAGRCCGPYILTETDVARVVEAWTGIPVQRITAVESSRLLDLEENLHRRIIGQDQAVAALSRAIRRHRVGFGKKKKPASFIFAGPTGVGKTELVKALAEELFESEEALIRLDMSEYMEKHTVSKMIGAPPGYVGYDEGGQLTEKVRRRPYAVLLFDEMEKAHPDVYHMLLQILDDGRLTDSQGRRVSFAHTVIVMTTNLGTDAKGPGMGFESGGAPDTARKVQEALKNNFRPEFLNRVDETIVFERLTREQLFRIMDLMLKEVRGELDRRDVVLTLEDSARDFLIRMGTDDKYGARPLRKAILRYVEDPLAEMILKQDLPPGCTIRAEEEGALLKFHKIPHPTV